MILHPSVWANKKSDSRVRLERTQAAHMLLLGDSPFQRDFMQTIRAAEDKHSKCDVGVLNQSETRMTACH